MSSNDSNSIVDSHGNPIRAPQSDRDVLEALIRSELGDAKESLRTSNESELGRIAKEHYEPKVKFWKNSAVFSVIIAAGLILWAVIRIPDFIDQKTQEFFRERLVGTALTNTIEMVISNRAAVIVDSRLVPLEAHTVTLSNRVEEAKASFDATSQHIREKVESQASNLVQFVAASTNAARLLLGLAQQTALAEEKLRSLESKTAAYQLLPDGRIVVGGTILGSQDVLIENVKREVAAYDAHDYDGAYRFAQEGIRIHEALPAASAGKQVLGGGSGSARLSESGIATMYLIGSHCAMLHKEPAQALKWARLAFENGAGPEQQVFLVNLLTQNGQSADAEALIRDTLAKGGAAATNFAKLLGIPVKK